MAILLRPVDRRSILSPGITSLVPHELVGVELGVFRAGASRKNMFGQAVWADYAKYNGCGNALAGRVQPIPCPCGMPVV
jgi:hypothetical protein